MLLSITGYICAEYKRLNSTYNLLKSYKGSLLKSGRPCTSVPWHWADDVTDRRTVMLFWNLFVKTDHYRNIFEQPCTNSALSKFNQFCHRLLGNPQSIRKYIINASVSNIRYPCNKLYCHTTKDLRKPNNRSSC